MTKLNKIPVVLPTKAGASEEKALAKCYDAMADTAKAIEGLLAEVAKLKPLAAATEAEMKKRQVIAKGRAAELKDMAKDRAKGQLHTNPSKMARVYKDLNEDVAQANWLEGGAAKALDEEFAATIKAKLTEVKAVLPAGVTGGMVDLPALVKTLTDKGKANGWKTFDALWADLLAQAEEKGRVAAIRELRNWADVAELKQGTRDSLIDKCSKDNAISLATAKAALKAALVRQKTPDKSRWANYLEMGAGGTYKLYPAGTFDGYKIHWTMSNDSWTAGADGGVAIDSGTAAAVLEKILKSAAGAQAHATLEIGPTSGYPHVYMFAGPGNAAKWSAAAAVAKAELKPKNPAASWEVDWVARAQAALTKVMTDLKADLVKKITAAQADSCARF